MISISHQRQVRHWIHSSSSWCRTNSCSWILWVEHKLFLLYTTSADNTELGFIQWITCFVIHPTNLKSKYNLGSTNLCQIRRMILMHLFLEEHLSFSMFITPRQVWHILWCTHHNWKGEIVTVKSSRNASDQYHCSCEALEISINSQFCRDTLKYWSNWSWWWRIHTQQ